MARHDVDPVLRQLVRAINESGQAAVPVTVSVHGMALTGALISQRMYFSELVEGNPLMSALEPSSGLLGKEAARDADVRRTPPAGSAGPCRVPERRAGPAGRQAPPSYPAPSLLS